MLGQNVGGPFNLSSRVPPESPVGGSRRGFAGRSEPITRASCESSRPSAHVQTIGFGTFGRAESRTARGDLSAAEAVVARGRFLCQQTVDLSHEVEDRFCITIARALHRQHPQGASSTSIRLTGTICTSRDSLTLSTTSTDRTH